MHCVHVFRKNKKSTASNSDDGVLCLAPLLFTFFSNYTITESCVMRLYMIRRGHTEEEKLYIFKMNLQTCYYSPSLLSFTCFPLLEGSFQTTQLCYPKYGLFKKIINKIIVSIHMKLCKQYFIITRAAGQSTSYICYLKPLCRPKTVNKSPFFVLSLITKIQKTQIFLVCNACLFCSVL